MSEENKQSEYLSPEEIPESIRKNLPEGAKVRRVKKKKTVQSETVREIQKEVKNRRDLVILQKAKQGMKVDDSTITKKVEEEKPKTFRGKLENFWYHHKLWVFIGLFVAVLLGIGLKGWLFPAKYDVDIYLASEFPLDDPSIDISEPFDCYTLDLDGDGEQKVDLEVMQVMRSGKYEMAGAYGNYVNIINQFRIALALGDYAPQIYVMDDANYRYMKDEIMVEFRDLSDLDPTGQIKGDRVALSELAIAEKYDNLDLTLSQLYVCIYDLEQMKTDAEKGTPVDKFVGNEKYMKQYNESLDYLSRLISGEEVVLAVKE